MPGCGDVHRGVDGGRRPAARLVLRGIGRREDHVPVGVGPRQEVLVERGELAQRRAGVPCGVPGVAACQRLVEQGDEQPVRRRRPHVQRPARREVRAQAADPVGMRRRDDPAGAEQPPRVDPPVGQLLADQVRDCVHRVRDAGGHRAGQLQPEVRVGGYGARPCRVPVSLPQPGQPGRQQPARGLQQVTPGVEQLLQQGGQRLIRPLRLPGEELADVHAPFGGGRAEVQGHAAEGAGVCPGVFREQQPAPVGRRTGDRGQRAVPRRAEPRAVPEHLHPREQRQFPASRDVDVGPGAAPGTSRHDASGAGHHAGGAGIAAAALSRVLRRRHDHGVPRRALVHVPGHPQPGRRPGEAGVYLDDKVRQGAAHLLHHKVPNAGREAGVPAPPPGSGGEPGAVIQRPAVPVRHPVHPSTVPAGRGRGGPRGLVAERHRERGVERARVVTGPVAGEQLKRAP